MDPGTAVGVASLGIQVCQGLVQYYDGWKDAPADIVGTLDCVKALGSIFDSLRTILRSNQLDQRSAANVEKQLKDCAAGVDRLGKKYSKIKSSNKLKNEALRLFYPFKISTLTKIKEMVADLIGQLQLALEVLDLAESTKFHAIVSDALKSISSDIAVIESNTADIKHDVKSVVKTADSIHVLSSQIDQTTFHIDRQTSEIKADTSSIANQAHRRRRQAMLDWLCPEDFSRHHQDFIGRRQEGSGKWFLQSPEVKTWLSGTNDTLLCEGDPGVGKTILAAVAIDHLLKTTHGSATPVVFIYCNYRRSDEHTCSFLLRSLLRQVVASQVTVAQPIYDLKSRCEEEKRGPSLTEVRQTLALAAQDLSGLTIVIDALDECSRDVIATLIPSLTDLRTACKVRIMATSRPLLRAMAEFTGALKVGIIASDEDIKRYVKGRMVDLPVRIQANADLQDEIVKAIIRAVGGVFLLAQLDMDSLKDKLTVKKVRNALRQLPQGSNAYDAAYAEAMARVHAQQQGYRALATQIFSWMVCARRPLSMSELQHALAVEKGDTDFDEENVLSVDDILFACVGLLTNDEQSNVVRLVHYTAQEYFQRTQDEWLPHARIDIAHVCITYLALDDFACGPCATKYEMFERWKGYAFLDYATCHWAEHFRECGSEKISSDLTDLQEAALKFLSSHGAVCSHIQVKHCLKSRFESFHGVQGIHLIALYGLDDLVQPWVDRHGGIDTREDEGRSALSLAAEGGLVHIVKSLISTGQVDINSKDHKDHTPLSVASRKGHHETVELLLRTRNVDADPKDEEGESPLSWASREGHYTIAELLLNTGNVNVNSKNKKSQTPLSWASAAGHHEIVELLLRTGKVEVDSQDHKGQTPLSRAAYNGHHETVELLLNTGKVSVDWQVAFSDKTPLCLAAQKGHYKVVELLLRWQADVESKDCRGRTPLSRASEGGYHEIVELLLQAGKAEVDSQGTEGRTSLSHAAESGYPKVVEILLEHNANVDLATRDGYTPLHLAVEEGRGEVVEMLLRDKANVNLEDLFCETPLFGAAVSGNTRMVELLLQHGADVNAKNYVGDSPLFMARKFGHEQVIEILLKHGACDSQGV